MSLRHRCVGAAVLGVVAVSTVLAGVGTARGDSIDLNNGSATLQQIFNAGGVATVSGLIFTFDITQFSSFLPADEIQVSALPSTPGQTGIAFTADWSTTGANSVTSQIPFSITTDGILIEGDSLTATGTATGFGETATGWTVTEYGVLALALGASGQGISTESTGIQPLASTTSVPNTGFHVDLDNNQPSGTASVSKVQLGFADAVPAPLPSAVWSGLAMLGLLTGYKTFQRYRGATIG